MMNIGAINGENGQKRLCHWSTLKGGVVAVSVEGARGKTRIGGKNSHGEMMMWKNCGIAS
jgi:hypothetical protein